MKRCAACGRAVDDESGVVEYASCPWCGGALEADPAGAHTLADALQVLWTVDPSVPYNAHAAVRDLKDLCPHLPAVSFDVRVAGFAGALSLLRDGKDAGAKKALGDGAHWNESAVESFVAAYQSLRPDWRGEGRVNDVVDVPQPDVSVRGVRVRGRIADFSWSELKLLSQAIASAGSDADGLAIAKKYNLVDGDGKLRGDEKPVTLKDGTKTSVRVAGLRHDELASGGVAGITFEFADVPVVRSVAGITFEFAGVPVVRSKNEKYTNAGGWEASNMRVWLNSDFLAMLAVDLRTCVEPARKRTNNWGKVEEGDTSCVTETSDSLWLLSMSEVYGRLSSQIENPTWSPATYDAEGTQYKLYADQGVTTLDYGFCKKSGAGSGWWLRSPYAYNSSSFHGVRVEGDWGCHNAVIVNGVSPGFCF